MGDRPPSNESERGECGGNNDECDGDSIAEDDPPKGYACHNSDKPDDDPGWYSVWTSLRCDDDRPSDDESECEGSKGVHVPRHAGATVVLGASEQHEDGDDDQVAEEWQEQTLHGIRSTRTFRGHP